MHAGNCILKLLICYMFSWDSHTGFFLFKKAIHQEKFNMNKRLLLWWLITVLQQKYMYRYISLGKWLNWAYHAMLWTFAGPCGFSVLLYHVHRPYTHFLSLWPLSSNYSIWNWPSVFLDKQDEIRQKKTFMRYNNALKKHTFVNSSGQSTLKMK